MVIIKTEDTLEIGNNIKSLTLPFYEILNSRSFRFDASVYCTEGRVIRKKIKNLGLPLISISPGTEIVNECFYPNRFKRIYVDKKYGYNFLLPSQITDINPKSEKFISPKTSVDINGLKAEYGNILLTRSGTIGYLTYVSKSIEGKVLSDDIIRIKFTDCLNAAYAYAFLRSNYGQALLTTNNYGAVVQHIEPSHLESVQIPIPKEELKSEIGNLIIYSYELRDESNYLINIAEQKLLDDLSLPSIDKFIESSFKSPIEPLAYNVIASNLKNRLDASFHKPIVNFIISYIKNKGFELTSLGDNKISKKIILPGRFKRVYVDSSHGTPFFGGKQIFELDPLDKKFLSNVHHSDRIKEQLTLQENMVLVTCSGTIGKVTITPKHWEGMAANQHIIRIVPAQNEIAGYIYAWLDTDYGNELIRRFTYGAVVDEIDDKQLAQVQIPLLENKLLQQEINDLVLLANLKRYQAFIIEKKALKILNSKILSQ